MTKIEEKLQQFYDAKSASAREELRQKQERDAEDYALKQQFLKLVANVIQEPCEAFCNGLEKRQGAANFHFSEGGAFARVEVTRLPADEWYPFMEPRTVLFHMVAEARAVRVEYNPEELGVNRMVPLEGVTMDLVEDALLKVLADVAYKRPTP